MERPYHLDFPAGRGQEGSKALCYGAYRNVVLTNKQIIFERDCDGERVLVAINADSSPTPPTSTPAAAWRWT